LYISMTCDTDAKAAHLGIPATNFPLETYAWANPAAAAEELRGAGQDTLAGSNKPIEGHCWRGIRGTPEGWVASIMWDVPYGDGESTGILVAIDSRPFADRRSAARRADAVTMVLKGLRRKEWRNKCLDFPMASYHDEELLAARDQLVAWMATDQFSPTYDEYSAMLLRNFTEHIMEVQEVCCPCPYVDTWFFGSDLTAS
jgi:hypothetical protein